MSAENKLPRPGEAALENMKLLKSESSVFKVPKVPKKKSTDCVKKSQVLDEDVYTEGIAKIIQRDFFPDLERLKAQNEYLEARENKDYARLQEITRKYSGNRPPTEPYNSPATFDTPEPGRPFSPLTPTVRAEHQPESVTETNSDKPKDIIDKHSLDSYLASHTSEDNASYDRLIALEDKKRATKLASQFEAEKNSLALTEAALALPSIEDQADQTKRPEELDTWTYKAKNYIMYVPDGAKQDATPRAELVHSNTRLRANPFDLERSKQVISEIAKSQDSTVSEKIGVDGLSISAEKSTEKYGLVGPPSPCPGVGPDASPLMTWGEIEGTPFRLDGGDTPLPAVGAGAAYRMLEGGARERIALQLAEQAARKRRPTTPRIQPHTPSFRTNTERLSSMSPAARRLATKHLLSPRLKLTPSDIRIHTNTPKRTHIGTPKKLIATPKNIPLSQNIPVNKNTNSNENNNITDNLLNISVSSRNRLTAKDFFLLEMNTGK